jgi:C1A family cysteine protease
MNIKNSGRYRIPITAGMCVVTLTLLLTWPGLCVAQGPRVAPLRLALPAEVKPGTGFVPPSGDLSHISAPMVGPLPILSSFDWREAGKVTPVKNQGPCGSCYAFGAIGNFEAKLLIDGGGLFDFSENNVKECEWWGSSCGGGNYWRVASFLAANGTVLEACDPYVPSNVACNSGCPFQRTLLGWGVISYDVVPSVNVLKSYIQTYGPVYTTLYAGNGDAWDTEFGNYDGSYTLHYTGTYASNHAVLIVGWDDDLMHAGGQGAWIVKNSWGTSWGGPCGYGSEGGYFTIAYGSAQIGTYSSFLYDWQTYDPNGMLLYYDEGGYTGSVGYGNPTAWGLCKFIPGEDVEVQRIEFWTLDATTDVDVLLYDDFNGTGVSNLLAAELNNSYANAGYHSVELGTAVSVTSGDDVYAVVKMTDASYSFPIAYDPFGPKASGCCYISPTGSIYSEWGGGDIGIRLRVTGETSCGDVAETPAITSALDVPDDGGGYVALAWRRSIYDSEESTPEIMRYRIWRRRREVLPSMLIVGAGPSAVDPFEHGLSGPVWEVVGTVGANGGCCYEFNVPTHCDSGPTGDYWTQFCVTAHTGVIGEHFDSPVDSGYSVDNLGMLNLTSQRKPGAGDAGAVTSTGLEIPRPNPGKDGFNIRFTLAADDWIQLAVYDINGRRVASIREGLTPAGAHEATWKADSEMGDRLSPGLYFVRLVTTREVATVKLLHL